MSDDHRLPRRLWLLPGAALALAGCVTLLLVWLARTDAPPAAPGEPNGSQGLVDRVAGRALRPGPLAAAHAELEGLANCTRCHGRGTRVSDERCLACHEEIGARTRSRLAFHGELEGACGSCHPDHHGTDATLIELEHDAFQHARTRYPLHGAHASVACEDCHRVVTDTGQVAFHYQGVPYASCDACHLDPHAGRVPEQAAVGPIVHVSLSEADAPPSRVPREEHPLSGRDCAECHGVETFRAGGLTPGFDHDADTAYALHGAHASLDCGACHSETRRGHADERGLAPGRGVATGCASCHDDPHEGALEACGDCHVERGWSEGFDHGRHTRFALDPLHARVSCGTCHGDARFAADGRECADCHRDARDLLAGAWDGAAGEPDAHADLECADCHGETAASNRGLALASRCTSCHPAAYGPLLATWRSELDRAATAAPASPVVERLRHSGVHNFLLVRRLLAAPASDGDPIP